MINGTCCLIAAMTVACGGNKPEPDVDKGTPSLQQQQQTVPKIVSVQCAVTKSASSQLKVTVTGEVPTGGWTGAALKRRVYVSAPGDSIWEYDLVATPPDGMAAQVITPITAEDTWSDFPAQSIAGIRIYGEGSGIKEIRLTQCATQ